MTGKLEVMLDIWDALSLCLVLISQQKGGQGLRLPQRPV